MCILAHVSRTAVVPFVSVDADNFVYFRANLDSAPEYLVVSGYSLLNARIGFRWTDGWTVSIWSRNLLNKDYFELLSAQPGNTGLYVGRPGDQRTVGVTMRMSVKSK